MPGAIYLVQGDELVEMNEVQYDSEEVLQRLLAKYNRLLAGEQIDSEEPRRWLLVSREVGIPSEEDAGDRWYLDHLFLDQDGIPTLVEVKRSTNSDIRRKVVGQMFDYAANAVVYWPVEKLEELFRTMCEKAGSKPDEELSKFLGPTGNSADFWQKVKTNLQIGKIRMIFVADEIPHELRQIVEFLNRQMNPAQVLALEVHQYTGRDLKTLVPRIIGQTAETAVKTRSSPGEVWTEKRFLEALHTTRGSEERKVAEDVLAWAESRKVDVWWGHGRQYGSFSPGLEHKGKDFYPFAVWTNGYMQVHFWTMRASPPFDSKEKRLELLARLNGFLRQKLTEDVIDRDPSIRLSDLTSPTVLQNFLSTFDWFFGEVKSS